MLTIEGPYLNVVYCRTSISFSYREWFVSLDNQCIGRLMEDNDGNYVISNSSPIERFRRLKFAVARLVEMEKTGYVFPT